MHRGQNCSLSVRGILINGIADKINNFALSQRLWQYRKQTVIFLMRAGGASTAEETRKYNQNVSCSRHLLISQHAQYTTLTHDGHVFYPYSPKRQRQQIKSKSKTNADDKWAASLPLDSLVARVNHNLLTVTVANRRTVHQWHTSSLKLNGRYTIRWENFIYTSFGMTLCVHMGICLHVLYETVFNL